MKKRKKLTANQNNLVPRPFHETIVDALHDCCNNLSSDRVFLMLLRLIQKTEIQKNHHNIIRVLRKCSVFRCSKVFQKEILQTKKSLLEQKKAHERASKSRRRKENSSRRSEKELEREMMRNRPKPTMSLEEIESELSGDERK